MQNKILDIQRVAASFYGVSLDDLHRKSRSRSIVLARQMSMLLMRRLTAKSFPEIGAMFDMDHTTVIVACRRAEQRTDDVAAVAAALDSVR